MYSSYMLEPVWVKFRRDLAINECFAHTVTVFLICYSVAHFLVYPYLISL
jgi:hypothetical protein